MATPILHELKKLFGTHGAQLWLVGGTVRDLLLNRAGKDVDLVTSLTPAVLSQLGFRAVAQDSSQPIHFCRHPCLGNLEVVVLSGPAELEADLLRRDFTVNAMAMCLQGEIIDPLGGQEDLAFHRLRACSIRTFDQDPLRIFRALRFVAHGWNLDDATQSLIRERDWQKPLQKIAVERFSREMLKALSAPDPSRFFRGMLEMNVARPFLPELEAMAAIPAGPADKHPEGDLLSHALEVLERFCVCSEAPLGRFCALFHDLGKLTTEPELYPRHLGHEERGYQLALALCRRLRLPASYGRALAWSSRLHMHANRWVQLRPATRLRVAEQARRAGLETILPLLALSDKAEGVILDGWSQALAASAMNSAQLSIDACILRQADNKQRAELLWQARVRMFRFLLDQAQEGCVAPET